MKQAFFLSSLLASLVAGGLIQRSPAIERDANGAQLFTIETAPGVTRKVTQKQKLALHEVSRPPTTPRIYLG